MKVQTNQDVSLHKGHDASKEEQQLHYEQVFKKTNAIIVGDYYFGAWVEKSKAETEEFSKDFNFLRPWRNRNSIRWKSILEIA